MPLRQSISFAGLFASVCALPVHAQVSPEQLWALWQDTARTGGYSVTATAERRDGASLILDGVEARAETETASTRAPIGQVVLRDRGDGTVEIILPGAFDIRMSVTEPDRDPVEMTLAVAQEGAATIVSGTAEAPEYSYAAETLRFGLASPVVNGEQMPLDIAVALLDVAGTTLIGAGAPMSVRYDLQAASMQVAVAANSPEDDGTFDLSFTAKDLRSQSEGMLPLDLPVDQPLGNAIAAGLRGDATYATGAIEYAMSLDDKGDTLSAVGTMGSSNVRLALTESGVAYQFGMTDFALSASGAEIPFPVLNIDLGEYALGFTMPLVPGPEPRDFGLLLRLADLVLPPELWAMVDPAETLPRDPATLVLDATGKATLFRDPTDPAATEQGFPGQVDAVTLQAMQLRAAGADLTGTGTFTLDNGDMQTFPGFPRPTGSLDLKLVGGNTLLDKLVALGFVPQEQMMGIRMGLALFTRPGDGPDTLTSRIEITPEAQIFANGQRIQ